MRSWTLSTSASSNRDDRGVIAVTQFDIVNEKLDQAVKVLQEKEIDLWLTFVRETTQVGDPCLDLVLGFGLTWQSALMVSRRGIMTTRPASCAMVFRVISFGVFIRSFVVNPPWGSTMLET